MPHPHLQGLSAVVFLALPAFYSLLALGRLEASGAAAGAAGCRAGRPAHALSIPCQLQLAGSASSLLAVPPSPAPSHPPAHLHT